MSSIVGTPVATLARYEAAPNSTCAPICGLRAIAWCIVASAFTTILLSCSPSVPKIVTTAKSGTTSEIQKLLDSGLSPNVREPVTGKTPLMYAVASGNVDVVQALLQHGADANAVDSNGTSVLFTAYVSLKDRTRMLAMIGLLLKAGASAYDQKSKGSLLFNAVETCDIELARLLLDAGVDASAKDAQGYYPIQNIGGPYGCSPQEDDALQKLLVQHGAQPLSTFRKK